MKCSECGREIQNPHYINGKAYGYNCYKLKLASIYKQWEDERNADYSIKCFSAIEIFKSKKSNSFHDSICKQWDECKKLTARQLECIVKGFTFKETISFYCVWFALVTNNECLKRSIPSWIEHNLSKEQCFVSYMSDEAVNNALLHIYPMGFHYFRDIEENDKQVYIMKNGKSHRNKETKERWFDECYLDEAAEDEYLEVLKVIRPQEQ